MGDNEDNSDHLDCELEVLGNWDHLEGIGDDAVATGLVVAVAIDLEAVEATDCWADNSDYVPSSTSF